MLLQVEYINMSQSINEVGQILKEHWEQTNKVYQSSVIKAEEESKDIITKHVLACNHLSYLHVSVYSSVVF